MNTIHDEAGRLADQDLVARIRGGDGNAFALLMRRHNRMMFRAARSILGNDIGRGVRDTHESEKELRPWQPIRRKGRPEEVTALMLHLASENAGYITGQCYLINGGAYFS